ncbi:tetratricopeptide repeat protein [Asaia krungthepensis]|nr:tetratricopeptide repeat protein [Asaia krungthepensis]
MIWRMIAASPRRHASLIDTALACLAGGDGVRAETLLRQVLAEDPACAGAWHGLACVARQAGQPRVAITSVAQALNLTKDIREKAQFHITLAAALDEAGHLPEAVAACRVALMMEDRDFRGRALLAELLHRSGSPDEARQEFRHAVSLVADPVPLIARYGAFLMAQRDFAEAREVFSLLVQHVPDGAEAYANLGAACFEAGAMSDALEALHQSLALAAPSAATLNNLALVLQALGAMDDAGSVYAEALELAPGDPGIQMNRATLWAETGHESRAEAFYEQVIRQGESSPGGEKNLHQAHLNLAMLQLGRGEFEAGWAGFEHRLALNPDMGDARRWQGETTQERVLIEAEQGLGDCLQFLRFVPKAARRAPLILNLPRALMPLVDYMPLLRPLLDSGRIVLQGEAEMSCTLLSLPFLMGIRHIDPAPIFDFGIAPETGRVGVFRAGNPRYRFDARRSLPASFLTPLQGVPGVTLVNLQQGDEPAGMEQGVRDDLLGTACEMARCELVIGVDTMLAHLAGASGRTLWLLDRQGGDWRWLGPNWYADMRVFRPDRRGLPAQIWPAVVDNVADALRDRYRSAPKQETGA